MEKDQQVTLGELKSRVQEFCEKRDWDPFHNPKDLAIGLVTEASELLEEFRFLTPEQVQKKLHDEEGRRALADEMADTFFFLLRCSQMWGIQLTEAFETKIAKNERKYPADLFKGKNHKSRL